MWHPSQLSRPLTPLGERARVRGAKPPYQSTGERNAHWQIGTCVPMPTTGASASSLRASMRPLDLLPYAAVCLI